MTPSGTLSIFAGTGARSLPVPGPALSSNFNRPIGVTVDGAGNLYIADYNNRVIEKVTPDGILSIFAGTGVRGTPTPGPATLSDLDRPTGVAASANGTVYIADYFNQFIEKVVQLTAPDAPTAVSGSGRDAQVTVSWSPPSNDGGSPITGYTVTASPGDATCATTGATSCTVTGLTNGTPYTFTVTATNAIGSSPTSDPSAAITPTNPPTTTTTITTTTASEITPSSEIAPEFTG